ncbi:MAG: porin family protein [Bacteroidetes bacterium]|nr:porin family protein [Bacteroidota bacterium]
MKKIVLIAFIACVLLVKSGSAQLLFGPQAGLSYATLTGTDLSLSPKPEWHAGLLFDIGLGKHFSLQPSLMYSKRGYKYDYETYVTTIPNTDTITTYTTASVDAALGYIDIPVLLNIYFGDHKGFMLNAGPQLSILLTNQSVATSKTTISTTGGTPQTTEPEKETAFKFNATDISLVAGIGYKLPKLLLIYLRASTGFGKVQKDKTILKDGNEGKNFTFELGLALTFGGK